MLPRTFLSCALAALVLACSGDAPPGTDEPAADAARGPDGRDGRDDAGDAAEDAVAEDATDRDTAVLDISGDAADVADTEPDGVEDTGPSTPPEVIVVDGAEALPAAFEEAGASVAAGPAVLYPADRTLMPRNVTPPVFQWSGNSGRYRFTFQTTSRAHHVYTTDWKWQPGSGVWDRLVSEARTQPVQLSVASLEAGGLAVGPSVTLQFSAANVDGAVYYWAPSRSGIVRLPLGELEPETFLTGTVFNCVGCHALSPDGSRLAYTRSSGGTPIGTLGVIGTDDAATQYVAEGSLGLYYPSFGPDNVHLAASRNGAIVVLNTDTGAVSSPLSKPPGTSASYPTWSPRDDAIVFAAGAGSMGGAFDSLGASSAGLARVRRERDGSWTEAEWLLENGAAGGSPENLFYPAYSPDGRWIAFNRARDSAAVGGSPAGAEIWTVSNEGRNPVELEAANGPDGTTNSWPKWAPASADGTLWVAFTSNRPYGRIGGDQMQIWIAGVTPANVLPGSDPSWSAFWLPGQSLADSNHVAYWAEYEKE